MSKQKPNVELYLIADPENRADVVRDRRHLLLAGRMPEDVSAKTIDLAIQRGQVVALPPEGFAPEAKSDPKGDDSTGSDGSGDNDKTGGKKTDDDTGGQK